MIYGLPVTIKTHDQL